MAMNFTLPAMALYGYRNCFASKHLQPTCLLTSNASMSFHTLMTWGPKAAVHKCCGRYPVSTAVKLSDRLFELPAMLHQHFTSLSRKEERELNRITAMTAPRCPRPKTHQSSCLESQCENAISCCWNKMEQSLFASPRLAQEHIRSKRCLNPDEKPQRYALKFLVTHVWSQASLANSTTWAAFLWETWSAARDACGTSGTRGNSWDFCNSVEDTTLSRAAGPFQI